MDLITRRDQLFDHYDQGYFTLSDVCISFVELMLETSDDEVAISLCDSIPDWFRIDFLDRLMRGAEHDYAYKWFSIGESRSPEQIKSDAKRHQAILKRVGPRLIEILGDTSSQT